MKPLKICMVTTFYPPYNFGGDGVFIERLVTALAKAGHEIHVIHDRDAYAFCTVDAHSATKPIEHSKPGNVTVHTLGNEKHNKLDLIAVHQLGKPVGKSAQLKELLSQGFDVIHFHNVSLMGGPEILKYGSGVKLCTLHDHWFVCATHVLWRFDQEACTKRTCLSCTLAAKKPPQLWRYTGVIADAARHIDAFIAPSHFAKKSHLANGFPSEIKVLPHFIPDEHRELSLSPTDSTESDLDDSHPRPYFLFVGRLEKIKGVQFLIEQFRNYRHADLVIAGTGNYEHELQLMAEGLNHIRFLGRVGPDRLKNFYRNAIATVVPSLCYETFGLVPLEGFAAGTPAIVHNLGALPEVVQGGGGLTYNNAEEFIAALESLRTDPHTRGPIEPCSI